MLFWLTFYQILDHVVHHSSSFSNHIGEDILYYITLTVSLEVSTYPLREDILYYTIVGLKVFAYSIWVDILYYTTVGF